MRGAVRAALILFALLVPVGTNGADEERARPLKARPAAQAVLAAIEADDRAALTTLAAKDKPDPWLVADELRRLGRHDAARQFAAASQRDAFQKLRAYLEAPPKDEPKARAMLEAMKQARAAGDWEGMTRVEEVAVHTLSGVRVAFGRAVAFRVLRRMKESVAAFLRAAKAAEAVGWTARTLHAYGLAGTVAYFSSDWSGAAAAWRAQADVARVVDDRAVLGTAVGHLGSVHLRWGEYAAALARFREALGIARAVQDPVEIAHMVSNIGIVQSRTGKYPEALASYEDAIRLARDANATDTVARTANAIGEMQRRLGNHAAALARYDESFELMHKIDDASGMATALLNSAIVHARLGDYDEAVRRYEASLALTRTLDERNTIALTLMNLGSLHEAQGDPRKALVRYEEALPLARDMKANGTVAAVLGNIGLVMHALGDGDAGLIRLQESLAIYRSMPDFGGEATTLAGVAYVQRRLGQLDAAAATYALAVKALEMSPDAMTHVRVLWGLARMRARAKDYREAIRLASEGLAIADRMSQGLAEGEGAGARDEFAGLYELALRAAIEQGDVGVVASIVEQGRAGSLRELLGSRAAMEAAVIPGPLRRALADARVAERQALDAYRAMPAEGPRRERKAARQRWSAARAATDRVGARIEREAKAAAQVALGVVDDLDELKRRLAPAEALVSFGRASGSYAALVVRRTGARVVPLAATAMIESAVDALLDDGKRAVEPAAVAPLRKQLIEPLLLASDVKRVLISPTGVLGYVPFALLFPDREVACVPSGTTYGVLFGDRALRGKGVLALGDPDYDVVRAGAGPVRRSLRGDVLASLPATRVEVEEIGSTKLLGRAATEDGLAAALPKQDRWRSVHFACHGLLDTQRPMFSSLALTASATHDGFLTCREIFRMRVPADLVVLSACETGKGRIYRTEGIVGLTRAFMFAGAPRVICSLWKVDDEATQALMVKFYELWNPKDGGGLGAAAALRQAQAHVRLHEHWEHPYYWAAWTLWGLPD